MRKLIVSPAPHVHGHESTQSLMRDVLIALAPSVVVSVALYGLQALALVLVSVACCIFFEWFAQKYMLKTRVTVNDLSAAVTGVLLALNLPPSAPLWLAVIGAVVAIGVAKMTFGGLGHNVFNPALVARVFLLISFPVLMTDWSVSASWFPGVDAYSGATPLGLVKEGFAAGLTFEQIVAANPTLDYGVMLFAKIGGSAGEASALALIVGFVYLLVRRVIRPHIPLTIIATVFVMSGIFYYIDPSAYTDPIFNVLTGGLLLGAIFMATDYVTSPMTAWGMIIYGIGIGVLTVLIRFFGAYPEGVSFAILIMNSVVPLLNKYIKPKRFGRR